MSAQTDVDILVVNSESRVEKELQVLLEQQGHHVRVAPDVPEALSLLGEHPAELLIVECRQLELAGGPLFRFLSRLRRPPMLLPTSPNAISSGGIPAEVTQVQDTLAQVQRLLGQPQGDVLRLGELAIDAARKQVLFRGQLVLLPPIQFRLLAYLVRNAGRVVDARELLKAVWGYEGDEAEARELVKVHVRQIRRRLGLGAQSSEYIQSVRGFGYVANAPPSA